MQDGGFSLQPDGNVTREDTEASIRLVLRVREQNLNSIYAAVYLRDELLDTSIHESHLFIWS